MAPRTSYFFAFFSALALHLGIFETASFSSDTQENTLVLACSPGASARPKSLLLEDVTNTIGLRAGYKINFVEYPWVRGFERAKSGELDGIYCLTYLEEREEWFQYFPYTLLEPIIKFHKRASDPLEFVSLEQSLRLSIVVHKGTFIEKILIELGATDLVMVYDTLSKCRVLLGGRVDLMAENETSCINGKVFPTFNGERSVPFGPPLLIESLHFAITKKRSDHKEITAALEKEFISIAKNGELAKIYKRHNFPMPSEVKALTAQK